MKRGLGFKMSKEQSEKKISTLGGDLEDFARGPDGKIYPTIENFYAYCSQRKLMGVVCSKCGNIMVPPRLSCYKCNSPDLDWVGLKGRGNLLTYSIVHVAPPQFQTMVPYVVGIVKLEEGASLPGIIKPKKMEAIKIGMELVVDFETLPEKNWLGRTRYYFKQP